MPREQRGRTMSAFQDALDQARRAGAVRNGRHIHELTPIGDLGLPAAATRALVRAGYRTVGSILKADYADVAAAYRIGNETMATLAELLAPFGWDVPDQVQ